MTQEMNRKIFFEMLANAGVSNQGLLEMQLAYWLAKGGHRFQVRDDGTRYFEHPRDVVTLMIKRGYTNPYMLVLGKLHDVPEDTTVPPDAIVRIHGLQMWSDLCVLSKKIPIFDPKTGELQGHHVKTKDEYYGGLAQGSRPVKIVKGFDRFQNQESMTEGWPIERQKEKALETRALIIPFVKEVDPTLARALERQVENILSQ